MVCSVRCRDRKVLLIKLIRFPDLVSFVPSIYLPLFVWIIFLGYILFPSKKYFNPEGRAYFYRLLKMILLSPC